MMMILFTDELNPKILDYFTVRKLKQSTKMSVVR